VGYFHVVFTLPHELSPLALQNKKQIYRLLLQASAAAIVGGGRLGQLASGIIIHRKE
jgi:hypothetical protein